MANRGKQHDHVVDAAGEHGTDQNPERTGHEAELSRQHRPQKRSGCRNCREMMAEQDVFVRLHIVMAVGLSDCRCFPVIAQIHHLGGDKNPIKPVGNGENAERRKNEC